MRPLRVALLCDYPEEGWASMDLVAEMILSHLRSGHAGEVEATRVCPPFRRRFGGSGARRNADRLLNRHADYPRFARKLAASGAFDLFHVVDHSYAQLVDALPTGRTVVTCHDLDTFRCLLDPAAEPRPYWFRAMTRRTLRGLQHAAAVAVDSEATRRAILSHGLIAADRLHLAYLAVHPECSPEADPVADAAITVILGAPTDVELLHVGTNIPRKRVDVLLRTFAEVRRAIPGARLLKAGGALPPELARLAADLNIVDAIATLPHFSPVSPTDRARLAAVYRRAALTLQPSDAEGFGLPVAESLACGTPVLASDLNVLREVGGDAASYAPVGDVGEWADAALSLLAERARDESAWRGRRERGLARASRFRWEEHARRLVAIYRGFPAGGSIGSVQVFDRVTGSMGIGTGNPPSWRLGDNHTPEQWRSKMRRRGWTAAQITEAIEGGQRLDAINQVDLGHGATRYVHPAAGRSVVLDDSTGEVIHVGGDGFGY